MSLEDRSLPAFARKAKLASVVRDMRRVVHAPQTPNGGSWAVSSD